MRFSLSQPSAAAALFRGVAATLLILNTGERCTEETMSAGPQASKVGCCSCATAIMPDREKAIIVSEETQSIPSMKNLQHLVRRVKSRVCQEARGSDAAALRPSMQVQTS